ncbi:MAG: ribonuclease P protein component [Candidatus Accumulibacter sp.]|nr:ribonuclease P protein component [Accumulibacter sp.]
MTGAQDGRPWFGQTFPRNSRLTRTDDFSSIFSTRKAIKSAHFLLHYRFRRQGENARLGVVVAKRLVRRAVDRNLLRRLARENFRKVRTGLDSRDLVLRLVLNPGDLGRLALGKEIGTLLDRMRIR